MNAYFILAIVYLITAWYAMTQLVLAPSPFWVLAFFFIQIICLVIFGAHVGFILTEWEFRVIIKNQEDLRRIQKALREKMANDNL